MLNRENLKIVALTSVGCAAVTWLAGHALFSRVSIPELNACHQYEALHAYNETNEATIERHRLKALATSSIANIANSAEDARMYGRIIHDANHEETEDFEAEDAYLKQAEVIGDVRRAKQFRFTETALSLLAFSSLCGLVIFITAPPRQS